jgi:hypothetical protein
MVVLPEAMNPTRKTARTAMALHEKRMERCPAPRQSQMGYQLELLAASYVLRAAIKPAHSPKLVAHSAVVFNVA